MKDFSKTKKTILRLCRVLAIVVAIIIIFFFITVLGLFGRIKYVANQDLNNPIFTNGELELIMFDVGQGEAMLFLQNDKAMLVDSGTLYDTTLVQEYLEGIGVKKLDYFVITHPHQDHAGGTLSILLNTKIDKIITPKMDFNGWDKDDTAFLRLYNFVTGMGNLAYGRDLVFYPDEFEGGFDFEDSYVEILNESKSHDVFNDYSIVMKVTYGDTSILLTGDMEKESENLLMSSGIDLRVDVYKAAHHGSRTSNSSEFLDAVSPSYVLISSDNGNDNLYGHPVKGFMNYLREHEIAVYRTDESGTIIMTSDGNQIRFDTDPDDYRSGKELLNEK